MLSVRLLAVPLVLGGLAFADTAAVKQAVTSVQQAAAKTPKSQDLEFRSMAAQAVQQRYPDMARQITDGVLVEVRANKDLASPVVKRALTTLAPADANDLFPPAPAGPRPAPTARPAQPAQLAEISKMSGQMRALPTDEDRAKLVLEIVGKIRALPPEMSMLGPISGLGNLVTEGDLGKDALNAVASTMAMALKATPGSASNYVELARLIRYEHLKPVEASASLDAATALLTLHDLIVQESGFTLTALDGKTYNLDALRGKVVLLNFWATWCPPCRREMPDMEKLYKEFAAKGLIVLAVSDEERATVEKFLADKPYTFPVVLDAGRKVNSAYGIEGIPNSFLFDRQGKLVGQSIDMRTERQFREMFRAAGLN